jgi:hypothetical protein
MSVITLTARNFVKVRDDHADPSRAGKDGQVMAVDGDRVALYFGFDRAGRDQHCYCAGPEEWSMQELDLNTVD